MRVILVRPNYRSHIITPPLGLGYLSSSLKKAGIESILIDGLKENWTNQELYNQIVNLKPDVVGINCLTAYYLETVTLAKQLKQAGIKVIIGGVHPTFLAYQTLVDTGADYIIAGEAENALTELLKNNLQNNDIPGVYSLANLKNDTVELPYKAEAVLDLDELPFPDWPQMPPATYPKAPHGAVVKRYPIGVIQTTRGCPYGCSFCASPRFYDRRRIMRSEKDLYHFPRIRFRSPENVIAEIEYLIKNFGVREIHFEDDNLTLKRPHIETICELLIRKKIKISWACPNGIRADHVDDSLMKLMAKSGCYYTAFGVESANEQILKNIHKREEISVIAKAISLAEKNGIISQGFFIFGLPGENEETIEETIQFALHSKLSRAQFLILDVLPGSELWETLKGQFQPDWQKNSYKEPEWLPTGLTKETLLKAQSQAFRRFFLRPRVFFRMLQMVQPGQVRYILSRLFEYRIATTSHS